MDFENDDNLDYQLNKIASIVIKEKRLNKGYSLDDVVNKLDNIITKQSLCRYENNEARMKNKIFKKICLALNEDPKEIWDEINNRFSKNIGLDNNETANIPLSKTQILFNKTKDILSDDDRETIEFIMQKTINNYEKNKNNKG